MTNQDNSGINALEKIHNAAFSKAKAALPEENIYTLLETVTTALKESKDLNEAINTLKDKYGDAAVIYLKEVAKNGIVEGMKHIPTDGMKKIDKQKFANNLVNASKTISTGLKTYLDDHTSDPDQRDAKLINTLCKSGINDIGLDVLQVLGVDKERIGTMTPEGFKLSYSTMAYVCFMEAYKILAKAQADAEQQFEETARITKECEQSVAKIKEYRTEMNTIVSDYFSNYLDVFNHGFQEMDSAILTGDTEGFIKGNVEIQSVLHYDVQFQSGEEFDSIMNSDKPFKL